MCCLEEVYTCLLDCDMFSVVNVYLDHLKLKIYVVCINGRRYVCCGECNVVSNECNEPTSMTCANYRYARLVKLCTLGVFGFRGELGFMNCDDICMCVDE